jgi:hypothetical protein
MARARISRGPNHTTSLTSAHARTHPAGAAAPQAHHITSHARASARTQREQRRHKHIAPTPRTPLTRTSPIVNPTAAADAPPANDTRERLRAGPPPTPRSRAALQCGSRGTRRGRTPPRARLRLDCSARAAAAAKAAPKQHVIGLHIAVDDQARVQALHSLRHLPHSRSANGDTWAHTQTTRRTHAPACHGAPTTRESSAVRRARQWRAGDRSAQPALAHVVTHSRAAARTCVRTCSDPASSGNTTASVCASRRPLRPARCARSGPARAPS